MGPAGSPAVYGNVCTGAMRCGKAENEIDLVLRSGGTPLPIVCDCVRICTYSGRTLPALTTVSVMLCLWLLFAAPVVVGAPLTLESEKA